MVDEKFDDIDDVEEIELHKNKKKVNRICRTKNKIKSRRKKIYKKLFVLIE